MAIVIVTQNQYIVAKQIHYVNLDEHYEYVEVGCGMSRKIVKELTHYILVYYTPDNVTPNQGLGGREERECSVRIRGKLNAHRVYRDLIRQIREQMPDQMYLDKALENLFGKELSLVEDEENQELLEAKEIARNDRSTKKVRRTGKTKRTNKKVLRGSKVSNSRSKK